MINLEALSAPFPPEVVHWRIGATNADKTQGMALAYVDARDVMERLDEVCGPENWQCRYSDVGGGKLCCDIGLLFPRLYTDNTSEWVWKADGAGTTDVEAEKGAFSDAFKRAAVRWGIGRYLYDIKSPWVDIEKRGKSHIIKQNQYHRLESLLGAQARQEAPQEPTGSPAVFEACKLAIQVAATLDALQAQWEANFIVVKEECSVQEREDLTKLKDIKKADLIAIEYAKAAS